MPILEYECTKCGERFEEYRQSRELNRPKYDKIKCPKCGAEETQRVYSTFSTVSSCNDTGYVSSG